MTATPERSNRWRWLAVGAILIGLALVLFFGFRAVRSYMRLQNAGLQPGASDVSLIRGWMTVEYLSRMYGVPREVIFEGLGIPAQGNEQKSLSQLNRQYAPGQQYEMLNRARAVIQAYLAQHPTNSPAP
jgi:hypothetical protein